MMTMSACVVFDPREAKAGFNGSDSNERYQDKETLFHHVE
jgi:hypothetical protein